MSIPEMQIQLQDRGQIHHKTTMSKEVAAENSLLADCLASADSFLASEKCWSVAKEKFAFSALDKLRIVSKEELDVQFATLRDYAPHRLLVPTYSCDALKLQRIGGKYAPTIGDRHLDGPKWMCGEFLEISQQTGACTIFSVGSNGDFAFEEDMKMYTGDRCKTFTFDCTGHWSNPTTTFNSWCITDRTYKI